MSRTRPVTIAILAVFALIAAACSSSSEPSASDTAASHEPVTIAVWDYYGKATPFQDT